MEVTHLPSSTRGMGKRGFLLLSRDYLTCDVYAYRLRDLVSHVTSNENGANEVKIHQRCSFVSSDNGLKTKSVLCL